MFAEGDHVRIKNKNVIGEIIDVSKGKDGGICYTVESDEEGYMDDPDAWNLRFPIFECRADQLEKV